MEFSQSSLAITTLGTPSICSPIKEHSPGVRFTTDREQILYSVVIEDGTNKSDLHFERAGPREKIFFDPKTSTAGIVTCGGLSPGLNNVIQSLVLELMQNYGVKKVLGFRHGFRGFLDDAPAPISFTPDSVHSINQLGGSILGSSRGPVDPALIAHKIKELGVNTLFCIGGDGTQRGASAIVKTLNGDSSKVSVVGIPKTIDNDVPFVWQTFGFSTAVEKAREVIVHADIEAQCFENSVCLVKLMGRDAGFIAMFATLAAQNVDFTLIPEVPFVLDGKNGLLNAIATKVREKKNAVVVVAEGAGQDLFSTGTEQFDASGNRVQNDIGIFLKQRITEHMKSIGRPVSVRYFDPSYSIRAVPANVSDASLCDQLSRAAVHAAMAGKTDLIIGHWYNNLVHVPIPLVCSTKKRINAKGSTYQQLLSVTGQGRMMG